MSKRFFIKSVGNIDDELLERFNEIDNRLSQKRSYKPLILKISAICFISSMPVLSMSSSLPTNGLTYDAPAFAAKSAWAAENISVTFVITI